MELQRKQWLAKILAQHTKTGVREVIFPSSVRQELAETLKGIAGKHYPYIDAAAVPLAAQAIKDALENAGLNRDKDVRGFLRFIEEMAGYENKKLIPSFVVAGGPVDRVESIYAEAWKDETYDFETPGSISVGKSEFVTELFHSGLAELIGLEVSSHLTFDQGGYHRHTVVMPRRSQLNTASSLGADEFKWHIDDAFAENKYSDFISVGAVRNKGTYTSIATLGQVLRNFSEIFTPREFELLTKPYFLFLPGPSAFKKGLQGVHAPVVQLDEGNRVTQLRIYQDESRVLIACDPKAPQSVKRDFEASRGELEAVRDKLVNQALQGVGVNLLIEPGSANYVFINNNLEPHRRTALSDRDNPVKNKEGEFRLLVRTSFLGAGRA